MIQTETIIYQEDSITFKGYLAYPNTKKAVPCVLIAPDWTGCNHFAKTKAEEIANLGYAALAMDVYGEGQIGKDNAEKTALMQPLIQNREALLRRIQAAYDFIKTLAFVEATQIAAIGFCFGGLCVLDLARSASRPLKGVASFHGLLHRPAWPLHPIESKLLILHGYADPMVKSEELLAFQAEMEKAGADWQMHLYGKTQHAFTNPEANDKTLGLLYDPIATKRAFFNLIAFLAECFS